MVPIFPGRRGRISRGLHGSHRRYTLETGALRPGARPLTIRTVGGGRGGVGKVDAIPLIRLSPLFLKKRGLYGGEILRTDPTREACIGSRWMKEGSEVVAGCIVSEGPGCSA